MPIAMLKQLREEFRKKCLVFYQTDESRSIDYRINGSILVQTGSKGSKWVKWGPKVSNGSKWA